MKKVPLGPEAGCGLPYPPKGGPTTVAVVMGVVRILTPVTANYALSRVDYELDFASYLRLFCPFSSAIRQTQVQQVMTAAMPNSPIRKKLPVFDLFAICSIVR